MSAKIIQFPARRLEQPVTDLAPKVPSVPQLILTLNSKYRHRMNWNEKHIMAVAEQLAMQGEESPQHIRMLHKMLLKFEQESKLATFHRVRRWFGRKLGRKGQ